MMSPEGRSILLLKQPRDENGGDPYAEALQGHGRTQMISVLEHTLDNEARLAGVIAQAEDSYSGVIVTSQRAVEAWASATRSSPRWTRPFFVVGSATERALVHVGLSPAQIFGAEEAGTGERLASFIRDWFRADPPARPLLYLVGDKRRDTISSILDNAEIALEELQVYSARPRADFVAEFERAIDEAASSRTVWIAFFSPSGAALAIPVLRRRGLLDRVCIAAIGPTTHDALVKEHHVCVHATAARPDAAELLASIQACDARAPDRSLV